MLNDTKWAERLKEEQAKVAAVPSLTYPSVQGFAYLLRNKAMWPTRFTERHDIMELARMYWPNSVLPNKSWFDISGMLGMNLNLSKKTDSDMYWAIFFGVDGNRRPSVSDVADRLDAFHANRDSQEFLDKMMSLRLGC